MTVYNFPGHHAIVPARSQHSGGAGGGGDMEARLAKLEANMEHVQADCIDIKSDLRGIRDKIDSIKDTLSSAKVWALLLYIGLAAGLLYTMARGFNWV
jgi:hypothetical protein